MAEGSTAWFDSETGTTVLNDTHIPSSEIAGAIAEQHPELAVLTRWSSSINSQRTRQGTMFQRDRYLTPDSVFSQFRVALDATETDDVVSGVLESTESLAFNKVTMECDDEAEEDVWNQIVDDIDLDERLREMWRETFTISQFYCAVLWGNKTYKAKNKTKNGNKAKKVFKNLRVPIAMSILDPLRVVPVGNLMFGAERLAYIASPGEATTFDEVIAGYNTSDQIVSQLIEAKYEPNEHEKRWLQEVSGARNLDYLYLFKEDAVFRHTATKPGYQRFATCRMKSIFELLDIKQQLREMDRAYLLGGTNFIILVKKGSDAFPAKQGEVNQLASQVRGTSKLPVIVGDHRIEIEIITPKLDNTLDPERYNTLDSRITSRLYLMFMTGNYAAGAKGDDSIKLARIVARGMESRRFMIYKSLNKHVFRKIFEYNDILGDEVAMNFHPKRIALDFDNNYAMFMQDLRDRGDISRSTLLAEVDLDQAEEAIKREREKETYDKVFTPTNVPFSGAIKVTENATPGATAPSGTPGAAPTPAAPTAGIPTPAKPVKPGAVKAAPTPGNNKGAGRRQGGNSGGGGQNRQSPRSGPGRGPAKAEAEDLDNES